MGSWHAFHNLSIVDPDSLKRLKEATWVENGVHRQSPGDSEEGTDLEDREMGLTRGNGEVPLNPRDCGTYTVGTQHPPAEWMLGAHSRLSLPTC